jgi:hypothetical protein
MLLRTKATATVDVGGFKIVGGQSRSYLRSAVAFCLQISDDYFRTSAFT